MITAKEAKAKTDRITSMAELEEKIIEAINEGEYAINIQLLKKEAEYLRKLDYTVKQYAKSNTYLVSWE